MLRLAMFLALVTPALAHADAPSFRSETAIGSHAMLFSDTPPTAQEAMFREAAASGSSSVRVDLGLPALTLGDERRNWAWVDRYAALSRAYHVRILGVITGTPYLLRRCAAGAPSDDRCPASPDAWGRLAGEVAARTRGTIRDWEIWNEPDGAWTYTGTPEQFAAMFARAADAIHAARPGARITTPGLMGPAAGSGGQWLRRMLQAPGLGRVADRVDIANVHVRGRVAQVGGAVVAWHSLLRSLLGRDAPLWITEAGYPSDPRYQDDPAYTGGEPGQARELPAAADAMLRSGASKIYFSLRDHMSGRYGSEGILAVADPLPANPAVRRKPAFAAVQRIAACGAVWRGAACPAPRPTTVPHPAPAPLARPAATRPPAPKARPKPKPSRRIRCTRRRGQRMVCRRVPCRRHHRCPKPPRRRARHR